MLFFSSTILIGSHYHKITMTIEAITNIYYFAKCFHITASFTVKSKSFSSILYALKHLVPTCSSYLLIHSCNSYASPSVPCLYRPCLKTLSATSIFMHSQPSLFMFPLLELSCHFHMSIVFHPSLSLVKSSLLLPCQKNIPQPL